MRSKHTSHRIIRSLLLAILLGLSSYSFMRITQKSFNLVRNKVWVNKNQPAIIRSADASYGGDYSRFVQFLIDTIPEEGTIILSRNSGIPQYDSIYFMQYFAFPRRVRSCLTRDPIACVDELSGEDVYILSSFEGLHSTLDRRGLNVIAFDDSIGFLFVKE